MFRLKVFFGTVAVTAIIGLPACGGGHNRMSTTDLVQELISLYTNDISLPLDINNEAQTIDDSSDTAEPIPVS